MREVLTKSLQARLGAYVVQARSVDDALAHLEAEQFDAILLDVNLPRVSGLEALPALRARAPRSRIVLMSAAGGPPMAERAAAADADAYVEKSAGLDAVCQAILPPR